MNMRLIDTAIKAYASILDEGDNARLAFFHELWKVVDECEKEHECAYEAPEASTIKAALDAGTSVFATQPVVVDKEVLVGDIEKLIACAKSSTELAEGVPEDLARIDWDRIIDASDIELAGANPNAYLMDLYQSLIDGGAEAGSLGIALMAATLALKAQLEKPAAVALAAIKKAVAFEEIHPMTCPVCGSAPTLSHVGGETSSNGRGRKLICTQCGTSWEFERVRCARCGTQNQRSLHFYNLEGDDNHRIGTCDECGSYIRSLFSESVLVPISYEVEDVVMAKLDAIAQNPAFAGGGERLD